jgi:small subunit ribosomal protein S3
LAIEKKFIQEGLKKVRVNEYFIERLNRAGYGGMKVNRTPMGTQVTIYAEKPGMVIGKGGKTIHNTTKKLDESFQLDNPQIDVQEVAKPELNAQTMANRLANALERGWYFRKAGRSTLQRIMDAGALGCEIILSGKLRGPRKRKEKFLAGYIKHAGKPAEELVDKGFAVATKKLGVLGVQVKIVHPDVVLPDDFNVVRVEAPAEEISAEKVAQEGEVTPQEAVKEGVKGEDKGVTEKPVKPAPEVKKAAKEVTEAAKAEGKADKKTKKVATTKATTKSKKSETKSKSKKKSKESGK